MAVLACVVRSSICFERELLVGVLVQLEAAELDLVVLRDGVDDAADDRPADEARQAEGGRGPLGEPRQVGRRQRGRRQPGACEDGERVWVGGGPGVGGDHDVDSARSDRAAPRRFPAIPPGTGRIHRGRSRGARYGAGNEGRGRQPGGGPPGEDAASARAPCGCPTRPTRADGEDPCPDRPRHRTGSGVGPRPHDESGTRKGLAPEMRSIAPDPTRSAPGRRIRPPCPTLGGACPIGRPPRRCAWGCCVASGRPGSTVRRTAAT